MPESTWYGRERRRRRLGGLVLTETAYDAGQTLPLHEHERTYVCLVVRGGFEEREGRRARACGPAATNRDPGMIDIMAVVEEYLGPIEEVRALWDERVGR